MEPNNRKRMIEGEVVRATDEEEEEVERQTEEEEVTPQNEKEAPQEEEEDVDVCDKYQSHIDWEELVNLMHNNIAEMDATDLSEIKTKDKTLEFINNFLSNILVPELKNPLNDFEKNICSLCILGFLLVVHGFDNDLVLNSSFAFESKKDNRLKFSLDFFNKKTNCYAYQVLLQTDFSTVKNNIIRVCIFKEKPDGNIFVITNPDPTSVFKITTSEQVEFIKTAEEKEKHIIAEYEKKHVVKDDFIKSQMPIIALLGAARKEGDWDKNIIYQNIEMIVSEILIRYCNIGFITGGYKGSKGIRKNPKQLLETLHPVGVTRAGYDIPKKYLKYTGVTVCEAGSKDSHVNPNFKCIFGKNWGDDTPALEYISDIAIFNAPFGAWTDLELLNFAVNKKKCFIYFNDVEYINKFGRADWLSTYLADTYILNYNDERFEFPIYKTNQLINMVDDIISHLTNTNLILGNCGLPKGQKSSRKVSEVFYDQQLQKWKTKYNMGKNERLITVTNLESVEDNNNNSNNSNNNLGSLGKPRPNNVFSPSKRTSPTKGPFRSPSKKVFRFPSVPEEPEGNEKPLTEGKTRTKSKRKKQTKKAAKSAQGKSTKGNQPKANQPNAQQPKANQPKANQPKAKQPKAK